MNARDRLQAARAAVKDGRYEEALRGYVWFHENALAEDIALRGVRLSFALGNWRDLGDLYPPALVKLQETADVKRMLLEQGAEDCSLFNDVVAIDRELKNERATYDLFVAIHEKSPEFAQRCAQEATPVMIKFADFARARSFIHDPQTIVLQLAKEFDECVERVLGNWLRGRRQAMLDAYLQNYVEDIGMLVTIFAGTGDRQLADELALMASKELRNLDMKKKVAKKLMRSRETLRQTSPT